MKMFILSLLAGIALAETSSLAADAPKKLLCVTTTLGYRHSSIPTGEKILKQLADESKAFTVEFIEQPEGKPTAPKKPAALKANASETERAAFEAAQAKFNEDQAAYEKVEAAWEQKLKQALLPLSPQSLKNYDGVIFVSTTGDLPIPDREGFLAWLKSGKAFIGMHAAGDTFHGWPEYVDMVGGEFVHHGPQVGVECMNEDPGHPATAHLGKSWTIQQEEIYQFKNYDPSRVHELLILQKHPESNQPGRFPVAWTREYGKGQVFYTSLGHREDIWDTDPKIRDRKNPVELSKAYQEHILGGIKWALGIAPAKPK